MHPFIHAFTHQTTGGLTFEEGYRSAGELKNLLDQTKWALDYMVGGRMTKDDGGGG